MSMLVSRLDRASAAYRANRSAKLRLLEEFSEQLAQSRVGGCERHVLATGAWHRAVALPLGGGGGDRRLRRVPDVITKGLVANRGKITRQGGTTGTFVERSRRPNSSAAHGDRLDCGRLGFGLFPSGDERPSSKASHLSADDVWPLTWGEKWIDPGGAVFRNLTRLSRAGIPTIAMVFGSSTAGGAYVPGMSDHTIMVAGRAKVFLGGPPLVKMATGEDASDEELGGAGMHATTSGLADHLAADERDGIRLARQVVRDLHWRKLGPGPTAPADDPLHDPEELLGLAPVDLRVPADVREVLARVVDGSRFDEWKPLYGQNLVCGWASVHGFPVGVLANAQGVLFSEESNKAAHFIQLANKADVPLVFLQNTTGYMVGKRYEQRGIIKDGAKMINAVSNSTVPHLTVILGASYGAGGYGMAGRAYDPRFLFTWPASRTAVMGPGQLAGVLSILARQSAQAAGRPFDEATDQAMRQAVEGQVEAESTALFNTGLLYDDGILDPRDTRTVLGIALSACHSGEVKGTGSFGVFRM
jgi:acetyl-CoA carboxylase carboxyltransferase component